MISDEFIAFFVVVSIFYLCTRMQQHKFWFNTQKRDCQKENKFFVLNFLFEF